MQAIDTKNLHFRARIVTLSGPAAPADTLEPVLHIHRASRADALADALAALLSESPADPFAPEVVAVPTRGMERWLTQRMSSVLGARPGRADGICANVEFPSPHRLVTDAVAAASGIDPAEDPWLPERSVWPLLTVVQESLPEPWLATLAAYLGAETAASDPMRPARQSRRLTTVRHLAGLFDRYALHRPDMLAAWARGDDLDALGQELPGGLGLAGRAVAAAAGPHRRSGPRRAHGSRLRADRRRSVAARAPRRGWRCSG